MTPCPAESQDSFTQLLMDISELKMELWAGFRHDYSDFLQALAGGREVNESPTTQVNTL